MATGIQRRFGFVCVVGALLLGLSTSAGASEIWVPPTSQQDLGGLEVASNVFWPATPVGAVRLAWSIPNDLQTFQSAKVAIIPGAPAGGPAAVHFYVCTAQNGDNVSTNCTGPFVQVFTSVANQLVEVEIGGVLGSHIGTPGANYLAILAYTTPATATDHIAGLRFSYAPAAPGGVATLAANTFTGTQTAPAFVGDGSGLTNLPFPAGAATLGANTFSGTQTAPAFSGSGASLTGVAKLAANTFTGTQTITAGNLNLDNSSTTTGVVMIGGAPFIHNAGSGVIGNTFVGALSGNLTTTGTSNVGVGYNTLNAITTGEQNTATGASALQSVTTGGANTAVGIVALANNVTGRFNTAIGKGALLGSIGDSNTAVGNLAGLSSTGSNNIYLGAGVTGVGGESNTMYLGSDATQHKTFIGGIRGVTTVNNDAIPVMIDSAGQLGTISSSRRFKEDIHDMADTSRRLLQLRPVTFRYTQAYIGGAKPIHYGLIAEEVAEVFPELAVRGSDGRVETVHYETLNVLLLNEVQRQEHELQEQRDEIASQRRGMQQQQDRIDVLEQRLGDLLNERAANRR